MPNPLTDRQYHVRSTAADVFSVAAFLGLAYLGARSGYDTDFQEPIAGLLFGVGVVVVAAIVAKGISNALRDRLRVPRD